MTTTDDTSAGTPKPITAKQADARRRNGRLSRGPLSQKGKDTSRLNSLKHGGWSRLPPEVTAGPLAEDAAEIRAEAQALLDDLAAPDDAVAQRLAADIVQALLRDRRLSRFEADVLAAPSGSLQAAHLLSLAGSARSALDLLIVWHGQEDALSAADIEEVVAVLASMRGVTSSDEWRDFPPSTPIARHRETLRTIVADNFVDFESVMIAVQDHAAALHALAERENTAMRPGAVTGLLGDGSLANLTRLSAHADRRIDTAFARYRARLAELEREHEHEHEHE